MPHRRVTLFSRDQRKRLEDVPELRGAQLIQRRDERLQACERHEILVGRQPARDRGDFAERSRCIVSLRDRQPVDLRRCYMRGDAEAYEVVHDVAVEDAAQEVLRLERQRRTQAEDRMRRNAARRENGRDEREPIRRARHVAVSEPWPLVPPRFQQPSCVGGRDPMPGRREADAKRLDLFSFDDGQARAGRMKVAAIVGGIERSS